MDAYVFSPKGLLNKSHYEYVFFAFNLKYLHVLFLKLSFNKLIFMKYTIFYIHLYLYLLFVALFNIIQDI